MYILPESPPSLQLMLPELFTKAHIGFAYRRSLRECCHFKLQVNSATFGWGLLRLAKGPLGPDRGMFPRRKTLSIPDPAPVETVGLIETEKLLPWLYVALLQHDGPPLIDGKVQKPFDPLSSCFS